MNKAPASVFVSNHVFPIILRRVCEHYGVNERQLKSPLKFRAWVEPRFVCWWLARAVAWIPLHELGRLAGGRDHTTVSNGIGKIEAKRAADPFLRRKIDEIWAEIAIEAEAIIGPGAVSFPQRGAA